MFITFEGTDGTGKTTQIQYLKEYFEAQGREVVITREPGGTPVAEKIRQMLLDKNNVMDDIAEAYLYAAARAEHVQSVVLPALRAGKVVLCDRFVDSSVAYQGYGRQLGADYVRKINEQAVAGCMPDRTYLLVLKMEDAEKRVVSRGEKDRMESAGEAFSRRVAEGFLKIAEQEKERIVVVNAGQEREAIARVIARDVANLQTKTWMER